MRVLFVLSGDPPNLNLLQSEINDADLTVAVDGGADIFHSAGLTPDIIIGDFDSKEITQPWDCLVIHRPNQDKTDLQKAFDYIEEHHSPSAITLLGAMGGRTDHFINNLQICAFFNAEVNIIIKNILPGKNLDYLESIFRITPATNVDLRVKESTTLSVFAVNQFTGLSSKGLKWELDMVNSSAGIISQSNLTETIDPQFTLTSGVVYISIYQ